MKQVGIVFPYIFLIVAIFLSPYSNAQNIQNSFTISDSLYRELIDVRNYLHNNPEPSGKEKITSSFIENYLLDLGLEVRTNIGGYGIVGILNGEKEGKKIAWRADIDAIPTTHSHEENESHSAHQEALHHCGHDVHTTIGLGIANILTHHKSKIKGTVYFIFQPSEENFNGAKAMIADGLFESIQPDEIYAAHVSPMPVGLIATKGHYLFADYKQINLTFKKNTHKDELIKYSQDLISDLQNVEPEGNFWKMESLMRPDIGIGSPKTIFKDFITVQEKFEVSEKGNRITVSGYVSASNAKLMNNIPHQLYEQIKSSRFAKRLKKVEFKSDKFVYSKQRGNVNNDVTLANKSIETLSAIKNPSVTTIPLYGVMPDGRGDDFAYFQEKIPGVYFFIGGSNFEKGIISMPHAPNFAIDETIIRVGVEAFSSLLLQRVNNY
ncbi:M20 metallopeptidase family protein [Flexithrix dorotheae]|uniref:M20 metallopeptidase family protein n=1 Tax=Flexithrix dorotheae TaxID=70993 RepID=UPI00036BD130|nr:M20/M25/M40 family metallo-hydrolase [Flexithrix dorotheae]